MSHATALVILSEGDVASDGIEGALEKAMAPYYEYLDQGDGEEYNHDNAKWDWYVIGGRWSNRVINTTHTVHHDPDPNHPIDPIFNDHWDEKLGGMNVVQKKDLRNIDVTLAVVHEGQWYERGELGWFGVVRNETDKDLWDSAFHQLIAKANDNDWLVLVDYHI